MNDQITTMKNAYVKTNGAYIPNQGVNRFNEASIKPKLPELRLDIHQYDAVALSETWLSPSVPLRLLTVDGYQLLRRDRPATSRLPRGRGGVAVLVRDCLQVRVIDVPSTDASNLEIMWTVISTATSRCLTLGSYYRHPTNTVAQITADLDDLEQQIQLVLTRFPGVIALAGDHNLNQLKVNCRHSQRFANLLNTYELRLINSTVPTYRPALSVIDGIAISRTCHVIRSGVIHCHYSPHNISRVFISISKCRVKPVVVMSRCLSKVDFTDFNCLLYAGDWSPVFRSPLTSDKWLHFNDMFISMLDSVAPVRRVRLRNPAAPPVSEGTRELMAGRRAALAAGDRGRYKALNRLTTSAIRNDCRNDIHRRIVESNRSNMWRCLKSVVGGSQSSSVAVPLVHPDVLNHHFVGVGPATAYTVPPPTRTVPALLPRVLTCSFRVQPVSLESLKYTVASMKSSKSCGIDGISVYMYQKCYHGMGHVILDLVNSSLTTGSVPQAWKHALITPIPKTDDLSDPSKFRPISVVPGIAKIVERIVHQQLSAYFNEHQLFSSTQHGYRSFHSTETALSVVTDHILSAMDDSQISLLVLCDLSKGFDVVNHQMLLSKLRLYNIDTQWFEAYLAEHSQQVQVRGADGQPIRSVSLPITTGVYQGTALGPILFSIFCNDLALHIPDATIVQYADDVQIFVKGRKQQIAELISSLERILSVLADWFCTYGMKVNPTKTQLMVYGTKNALRDFPPVQIRFGNSLISESLTVKNLGLTMDRFLSFEPHINQLVAKCTGVLISLSHTRHVLPSFTVAHVVNALVVSSIRYCISIYGTCGKTQLHRVQKLLNFCARVISGRRKYDHISAVLRQLNWLRAEQLVSYHQLC